MTGALLEVASLTVRTADGAALVEDLSFSVRAGERLALIGESGSGKSVTGLALVGLLPEGLRAEGSVRLDGVEVVGARERVLNGLRGSRAGVVFQEPLTALDPLMPLGRQVAEPLQRAARQGGARLSRPALRAAVTAALAEVRLDDAGRIAAAYPHEVSGGQRQRVAIAMALARRPRLLIADEPTTALDVTVQAEVLDLLDRVTAERGTALLFVSHDLAVVARTAPRALVLRRGRAVEEGAVADLVAHPAHEYTRALVAAARELDAALDAGGTA